ncbi:MAG: cache domain-containing protein, partial [Oscillospiraceae bacterium]
MKKSIFRTNFLLAAVIVLGFGIVEVSTTLAFRRMFVQDIEYVSELTSENMYMGIKELMAQPINVSLTMARDSFLQDFMLEEAAGAQSPRRLDTLQRYLAAYQEKNGFDSVFLVSTKTGNYYHYKNGIDRVMSPENEEDVWYYDFLRSDEEYGLNVDNDQAKNNRITVFVNCKLKDAQGKLLGVIGVGMETPYIQNLLGKNEAQYQIAACLVDKTGKVQLSSTLTEFEQVNLFDNAVYADLQAEIVSNKTSSENRWYTTEQSSGYFVTRYIPYLNWYLVVEKSTDALHQKLLLQAQFTGVLTLLVLSGVL